MTPSSETNSVTTIFPMTFPPSLGDPGPAPSVTVYTNGSADFDSLTKTFSATSSRLCEQMKRPIRGEPAAAWHPGGGPVAAEPVTRDR